MSEPFRKPPIYEPADTTWPALLAFQTEVAMDYRWEAVELRQLLAERDREIANLHRKIEICRRLIRTFEQREVAG